MSLRLSVLALTLALGTAVALAAAPGNPPAGGRGDAGARGARGAQVPANLEGAMSEMQRSLNALKAEINDKTKLEQTLRDIAILQRDTITSKMQIPPSINRKTGEEKTKATSDYRAMMNSLVHILLDLEDAVNDNKPDAIKKNLASIEDVMKQGHTEFRPAGRGGD
jgi:hypothetical protein